MRPNLFSVQSTTLFFLFSLFSLFSPVHTFNYLVFCPLFGHSHNTFFGKVADTLTDAGHNVTFFTPTIVKKYRNVTYTKSTKDVVHLAPSQKLVEIGELLESGDMTKYWTKDSGSMEIIPVIQIFQAMYHEVATVMGENLGVLDDLKTRNFDVIIFESYVFSAYPLMDYLQIKTFIPSLSVTHDITLAKSIGEPAMPSVVSDALSTFGDRLTITERAVNLFSVPIVDMFLTYPIYKSYRAPHNLINIPQLEPHASFIFLNSNPFVDFPRPTLTKTVQIGGLTVDLEKIKSQRLDEYWSEVLERREKTVLISFGSMMFSKDMPLEYKKALVEAVKRFPKVTFIWKYESEDTKEFAEGVENVVFAKWVPQLALLADTRLSAFFTHAGLGSVNEVSYLGKPTIVCPLFADQMRNAKMLARHNGSIELSKFDLTNTEKLVTVLHDILYDEKYQKNSENLADQLRNQPIRPKELMVRHAEFAARFGRLPSLDPFSRQMSFVEYFLLDVVAICLFILVSVVLLLTKLVRLLGGILMSKKNKEE